MKKTRIIFSWPALIIIIAAWIFIRPMGYVFVLTGPQYAKLVNGNSVVAANGITLNGQHIPINNSQWKIELVRPKTLLSGAEQIKIWQGAIENKYYLSFTFCPKTIINGSTTVGIINDEFALGIFASQGKQRYLNETEIYISKRMFESEANPCEENIPTMDSSSGEIVLGKFKQSMKHLTLKGSLRNINTELIGVDEDVTMTLTIESLDFSIDSPVIYEWSNKAGKTWRL